MGVPFCDHVPVLLHLIAKKQVLLHPLIETVGCKQHNAAQSLLTGCSVFAVLLAESLDVYGEASSHPGLLVKSGASQT